MMGMTEFAEMLLAYGADPARWPADRREAALALLSASDEARVHLERAAGLDALLDLAPDPCADQAALDRLARTIVDSVPAPGPVRRAGAGHVARLTEAVAGWLRGLAPLAPNAAGLAACALAGILSGTMLAPAAPPDPGIAALAFTPTTIERLFQ